MSALPPVQPNAQQTTATAKIRFHIVMISCWPTEYAAAVVGVGDLAQGCHVDGLRDACAARGDGDRARDRVAAGDRHDRVEGDRDPVGGQEDADDAQLREPGDERRDGDPQEVVARARENRAAASPAPRGP